MNSPRYDILGLGCAAVDDLIYVDRYPGANAKQRVLRRERQCGGLTATALVAAARLGARCAYAGVLGSDTDSRYVLDTLDREGIETRHTLVRPHARPIRSVIVVEQTTGKRTILYDTTGVIGAGARHPSRSLILSSRVLYVDRFGLGGMVRAARLARAAGIPIVADFETADTPGLASLVREVDHLVVSEHFARSWTGLKTPSEAVRVLRAGGHSVVVVTCGERGCYYQEMSMPRPRRLPAYRVRVADTTGCGDVFHGAYAFGLARGLPLEERLRLASATAALKASHAGGQAGIPTLSAVKRWLR